MCQKAWELPPECAVQQYVLRRRGDPLLGADDVCNLHEVIVDDIGEVIGGEAVRLQKNLIVDIVVFEGDVARGAHLEKW